ncbi:MAG TPA: oligoendopeptidase F, partial [Acidobacteria bacterium]|nr:oligoendopeptidase F [Acidobacteriota bacterium]
MKQRHAKDDTQYRWDLSQIYPDTAAWKAALDQVQSRMDELDACKGSLGKDARSLKACLDTYFSIMKELRRVGAYASMLSDEDTRNAKALEMRQTASMLGTRFSQRTSFLRPEILALGEPRI